MSNAIIGSNGFIGSRLKWYADNYLEDEWIGITRENYDKWKGCPFDALIWAAGSARKDLPVASLMETNAVNVQKALNNFPFSKVVYISSQAVYADPKILSGFSERHEIIPAFLGVYGLSKYLGEVIIRESCSNWLIIRPNGFVGPNLKKNVIHSLAKDPPELYYTMDSKFQVIHTDVFAAVVFMLADTFNREIFNVASPEIVTPPQVAQYMGVDIKKIQMPKDRVPPHVHAVFSTEKLDNFLKEACIQLPSAEEAIRNWNGPYQVRMPKLREPVGGSGGQRG